MGMFERLNAVALQQIGRQPEWYELADPSSPPETANDGVGLGNTPTALVALQLRETLAYRTARVTVGADPSSVYEVTVDGTTVSYDASSGDGAESTIIQGLVDAINDDATVSGVATAHVEDRDDDGHLDTARLEGDNPDDYTIGTAIASGGGTIDHTADATQATLRLYGYPRGLGDTPTRWTLLNQGEMTGLDHRGLLERISVAGLLKLYPQVIGADGQVAAAVGPTLVEDG